MIYIALKLNKVTQKRLTTNMYTKELESTKKLRKLIYMIKNSLKNIHCMYKNFKTHKNLEVCLQESKIKNSKHI